MLLHHESRCHQGTRTRLYRRQNACTAIVNATSGLLECRIGHCRQVRCMAIGDRFLYHRLGKTRNDPGCRLRSLHVHQGRCNAQRSCAPHFSVSTCSRGRTHVHLNTEVYGSFWDDAADRAAGMVYYKVTRAGILCVPSQSLGFFPRRSTYLAVLPQFNPDCVTVRGLPHLTWATLSWRFQAIPPIRRSSRP